MDWTGQDGTGLDLTGLDFTSFFFLFFIFSGGWKGLGSSVVVVSPGD